MAVNVEPAAALSDLIERHRGLYNSPEIDVRLERIIRPGPPSQLSSWDLHRLLRTAQAVFFDTHVEVVSGHHTATYLRFDSIGRIPELVRLISRDMARWIGTTFAHNPVAGLLTTRSAAERLAVGVSEALSDRMRVRTALTPYCGDTGRIGTDIGTDVIRPGERFVALNDVTTRGNCVAKLGKVIADHGGTLAGMLVFARRDSGQFPFMTELAARHPFYYAVDLDMPQWDPGECPLCREGHPLLSWKDMPEL